MFSRAEFALAHPVFDPERDMRPEHTTLVERNISAGLTVNIGME